MSKVRWDSQPLDTWADAHARGKFINLDGNRTHYIEQGDGPPLILLHGFFYDTFMWHDNIDALATRFHVYALDLWGFGYSTREPLDYGFPLYARQLESFMDALGIERASIAGQSMGGGAAMVFTLDNPERVEKLILVDSAGMPNTLPLSGKFIKAFPAIGRFMYRLNTDLVRKQALADFFVEDRNLLTPDYFENLTRFHKIQGTIESMLQIMRRDFFYTLHDQVRELGQLGKDILIVWGEKDRGNPLKLGRAMHELLKGSKLAVISGSKHVPNSEKPEQFNRLALEFLLE